MTEGRNCTCSCICICLVEEVKQGFKLWFQKFQSSHVMKILSDQKIFDPTSPLRTKSYVPAIDFSDKILRIKDKEWSVMKKRPKEAPVESHCPKTKYSRTLLELNSSEVWFYRTVTKEHSITRPPDIVDTSAIAQFDCLSMAFMLYLQPKS